MPPTTNTFNKPACAPRTNSFGFRGQTAVCYRSTNSCFLNAHGRAVQIRAICDHVLTACGPIGCAASAAGEVAPWGRRAQEF